MVPTVNMTSTQQTVIHVQEILDRKGKPAKLDPKVLIVVTNGDPNVLRAELVGQPTEAPFDVNVFGVGGEGDDSVLITGDSDLGDGVESFVIEVPFHVTAAHAYAGNTVVAVDTPIEQP